MDFDSSSKFISSLAKFLQSLCNGYVEFNSGVEVIGHIYLSVDTGKKIDYILNEKVCKTDENSVTFISNSFHAQPAEKPKPPVKNAPNSDPIKPSEISAKVDEDDIIIMEEPESKNVGTIPSRENFHSRNTSPQSKTARPSKRSFNQSFPSSHKHSAKQSRSDPSSGPNGAHLDTDSIHSESNTSSNFLPPQLATDTTITAATESDMSHLSKVFPQNFNDSVSSIAEERDVKPQLDSEMKIIQVKQEYDQSGQGGEDDQESFDDSQDQSSIYPGMPYDQYYGDGSRRGQRLDYGQIGGMSQGEYFQGGAGPSGEAAAGDSSAPSLQSHRGRRRLPPLSSSSPVATSFHMSSTFNIRPNSGHEPHSSTSLRLSPRKVLPLGLGHMQTQQDSLVKEKRKMNFACEICGKRLPSRREYIGHMNGRHLGQKPFSCELCGRQFAYITSLPMHRKTCPAAQLAKLNSSAHLPKFPNTHTARNLRSVEAHPPYLTNSSDNSNLNALTFITSETPDSLPFTIHLPRSSTGEDIDLSDDV